MDYPTYARHDFRLALLTPLGHLGVDLFAHLAFDLACVAGEQRQETLRPAVDDVNLVQAHRVHHLLTLLQLPFRTLDKLRLPGNKYFCFY